MKQQFQGWAKVAVGLEALAEAADGIEGSSASSGWSLNAGQRASLRALATRLPQHGVVIADEVGMGKTRIATALARCVVEAGGRVAILVPPGLGPQWRSELRDGGVQAPPILRSLWQYLQTWSAGAEAGQSWFDHSVLLVSHAFSYWSLGENSDPWRWALLPELYAHRRSQQGRFPRGYHHNEELGSDWEKRSGATQANARRTMVQWAAKQIVGAIEHSTCAQAQLRIQDLESTPWPGALQAAEYSKNGELRERLQHAVGLGLGSFDLVVIDEAHKSRGSESSLTTLLEHVVLPSSASRRLAMTATPVELDVSQWQSTLGRISNAASGSPVGPEVFDQYAQAIAEVRRSPANPQVRQRFETAATAFEQALTPYLLRRDKREDPHVQEFGKQVGGTAHAYRRETAIKIDTSTLSPAWKQAVCAAEALSLATHQSEDSEGKRLRLTLGNGHGIAAALGLDGEVETTSVADTESPRVVPAGSSKRQQRVQWWRQVMREAFSAVDGSDSAGDGARALFEHPAVLAAVQAIEATTACGEKVLVFGRFNAPLRALAGLLNAREMLRCLSDGNAWPQSMVHENEWPAVQTAWRQLRPGQALVREQLDEALKVQYRQLEDQREHFRSSLVETLGAGLAEHPAHARACQLFEKFKADALGSDPSGHKAHALVARALLEALGPDLAAAGPSRLARCFAEMVDACCDRDDDDEAAQKKEQEYVVESWGKVLERIDEEFANRQGEFARVLNGQTPQSTRQLLQLAFNREHSHPRVLVAQSAVGREGLNLHRACRTVVLLHPEWNPGVVEQQIGRVDRIGSLWERLLRGAIDKGTAAAELPRIEVQPIIFGGTYDEMQWEVLRGRWDDLRAQLHGVVVTPRVAAEFSEIAEVIEAINAAAPNFSPPR